MRRGIIKHCKRTVAVLMITTLITTGIITPKAFAKTLADKFEGSETVTDVIYNRADVNNIRYKDYFNYVKDLAEKEGITSIQDYDGKDIVLTPAEAICKDLTPESTEENPIHVDTPLIDESGKTNVINWGENYSGFEWTVNVPKTGYYNISLEYIGMANVNNGMNPSREIAINGVVPFTEAMELVFKRWWRDTAKPDPNALGDESAPNLVEVRQWETAFLRDADGYYSAPFKFFLKEGTNKITLNFVNREMFLGNVILSAPEVIDDYATVSSKYSSYDVSGTQIIDHFEAEDYDRIVVKSSNMMRITSSKDITVTPFKSGYTVMNQVGGQTNWYQNRDSYTWKFSVPENGLYKIAVRVGNNFNVNMPVYRQIYIDNKIPFSELYAYKFMYNYNYYTETLSDGNGNPYLIYLEKGEHTLKMETLMGELGNIALTFYDEAEKLNYVTREIQKIIGDNPDTNYNYRLDQRIPTLMPTLEGLISTYENIVEVLKGVCGKDSSSMINELKSSIDTLKACIVDPTDIPERLGDIVSMQTTMGTWISTLESSALQVDFIEIAQPAATVSNPKASFWARLKNVWDSFIVSFSKDYNSQFDEAAAAGKKVVEIWLDKDREYGDLITSLLNSADQFKGRDFVIKVRMTPGQTSFGTFNLLLLSIMSNQEPDMIWGCNDTTPVNFAIRDIGYNLENFDDFDEIAKRFCEGVMVSLQYSDNTGKRNGTFGLQETMNMNVAFYRTDIFSELGIPVPQTWDDVYETLLPAFYKESYNMLPVGGDVFLYQSNGYPYRAENKLSGWDTKIAYDAFIKQVNQYLIYGMDVSTEAFQGFRNGQCPYIFGDFNMYTQLTVAAPELMGKWAIAMVPGTYDEYGVLNRAVAGSVGTGTALMILPSSENKDACWEIMKWWTSAEVQTEFSYLVDAKFGQENRWCSSNKEAFLNLPWSVAERKVIEEMYDWYMALPVILGSYQQDRYSNFAFNQVVLQGLNARDSLETMVNYINPELERKQKQYGITTATPEEINNKVYDVTAVDKLSKYRQLREEAKKAQMKG